VVEANSVYECDNTYQLINFYHTTLNYLVVSMLVKAIEKGNTRMAHRLHGLVNNLLSGAVLWNVGCKVYFHSTGCGVTLNGEIINQGWRDPKNRLW
jgi:hypothetical protein